MMNADRIRRMVSVLLLVTAGCVVSVPSTSAHAQDSVPKPPTTTSRDTAPKILNYLLLTVLVGAVVGASVFPSKRGHQD